MFLPRLSFFLDRQMLCTPASGGEEHPTQTQQEFSTQGINPTAAYPTVRRPFCALINLDELIAQRWAPAPPCAFWKSAIKNGAFFTLLLGGLSVVYAQQRRKPPRQKGLFLAGLNSKGWGLALTIYIVTLVVLGKTVWRRVPQQDHNESAEPTWWCAVTYIRTFWNQRTFSPLLAIKKIDRLNIKIALLTEEHGFISGQMHEMFATTAWSQLNRRCGIAIDDLTEIEKGSLLLQILTSRQAFLDYRDHLLQRVM